MLNQPARRVVQLATDQRYVAMEYAQNASGADSDASSMVQGAPRASYFAQKTYRRILGVLAPYLADPSAQSVTRLVDTFRRSGRSVVFQRDATLQIEELIKLDASTVDANIDVVDPTFGGGARSFTQSSTASTCCTIRPGDRRACISRSRCRPAAAP